MPHITFSGSAISPSQETIANAIMRVAMATRWRSRRELAKLADVDYPSASSVITTLIRDDYLTARKGTCPISKRLATTLTSTKRQQRDWKNREIRLR